MRTRRHLAGVLETALTRVDYGEQVGRHLAEVDDLVLVAGPQSAESALAIVPEHQQLHVSSMWVSSDAARSVPAPRKSSSKSCRWSSSAGLPSRRTEPDTSTLVQSATCRAARARCSTSSSALPRPASRRTCSRRRLSASFGDRLAV